MPFVVAQILLIAHQAVDLTFLVVVGFTVRFAQRVTGCEGELMVFIIKLFAVIQVEIQIFAIPFAIIQTVEPFRGRTGREGGFI